MFDPSLESQVGRARPGRGTPESRLKLPQPATPKAVAPNWLDSEQGKGLHNRLLGIWHDSIERHADNRAQMDRDHRLYDNEHYSEEDLAVYAERGQKAIQYPVVASAIDWVLGTEKRMRTDFKVLPRLEGFAAPADAKSDLLKYLSDVNDTPFARSRAFADAVKGGVGWLEDGIQHEDDGEPIYSRYESWRNMLWDATATEMDLSDARFILRQKWVDYDVARAWFPKREGVLAISVEHAGFLGGSDLLNGDPVMDFAEEEQMATTLISPSDSGFFRERTRVIECWFQRPMQAVSRISGGQFSGEIFDPDSAGHQAEIDRGTATVAVRPGMRMHCAVFTTAGLLYASESPYRHNRFPFTPIFGFRRDSNNMPYGMVRRLYDMQVDVDHRASKALHILSTNKTIMDKGAVDDVKAYIEEVSRSDAVIEKKQGYALEINVDRDLAPAHLEMMVRTIAMIEQASGVNAANQGRPTDAHSGVAIGKLQDQGSLQVSGFFDNALFARKKQGEKQLSLIEQFVTAQKAFRITGQRGRPKFVTVNSGLPEDDVTASKADFILSEDEWSATLRQARAEQVFGIIEKLAAVAPQVALTFLDLALEMLDLPAGIGEEMVARVRQITGMPDPDSAEPTPEQAAAMQKQADQEDRANRMQEAEIADKQAAAAQKQAAADKAQADIEKTQAETVLDKMTSMLTAMQAAVAALTSASVVPIADQMLAESGFVSESDKADAAAVDTQAQKLEALAAQGAQMQAAAAPPPPAAAPAPAPQIPPQGA